MIVRRLRATDAPDLHHNCFSDQSLCEVQDYLDWCLAEQARGRLVPLVVEVEGKAVASGQLALRCHAAAAGAEIGSLVVAPAHRRRGFGTALVLALLKQARQHSLQTLEISANVDPTWIHAWYERLGFTFHHEHDYPGERVAILTMDLTQGDPT